MRIRVLISVAVLLLALTALSSIASAQTYVYDWMGVRAGVAPSGGNYTVDDFGGSFVNFRLSTIDIDLQMIADDNNYQFLDCNQVGTYSWDTYETAGLESFTFNIIGTSIYNGASGAFVGDFHMEAAGYAPFYAFSGDDFAITPVVRSTVTAAFHDGWQGTSWGVPFYWDTYWYALVSPYANYYHNHAFWPEGWRSEVTVTNQTGQSIDYEFWYTEVGGTYPFTSNTSSCGTTYDLNRYKSAPISNTNTWSLNLITDVMYHNDYPYGASTSETAAREGYIVVNLDPVVGGTLPTHYVVPNSSGTNGCGTVFSMPTSCQ